MSTMAPTWQASVPEEDLASATPYPSAFAMTIGDFLITLPQLLEVLVPEESPTGGAEGAAGADGGGTLATEWLDRAASGIVEELQQRVLALPKLGSKVRLIRGRLLLRYSPLHHGRVLLLVLDGAVLQASCWDT